MNSLYSKLLRARHNIFYDAPSGINQNGNMSITSDFEKQSQAALSYARYAYGSSIDIMIANFERRGQTVKFSDDLLQGVIDSINLPSPFQGPNHPDAHVTYCGFYAEAPDPVLKGEIEKYHARFKAEMTPIMEMITGQAHELKVASPSSSTSHHQPRMTGQS